MRKAALKSALSVKAAEQNIVVLDELSLPEIKTRLMVQALDVLAGDASALLLIPESNGDFDSIILSTRNIPDAKTLMASYLNISDLFSYEKLIFPVGVLDVIASYLD